MSSRVSFLALLLTLVAAPSIAQVTVKDAWVRGTVAGQKATGAFMQLQSPADTTLIGASSPAARVVEIHEMAMDGGVMKMRPLAKLALPAGKNVELKPGGNHVMLMDLSAPLPEGSTVEVTFTFADKDGRKTTQQVKLPVKALTAPAAHKH